MNFNPFSKKAAKPAESTITLTIYFTDDTYVSKTQTTYLLDEYEKYKESFEKIVKKIHDDIKKGNSLINAWNNSALFRAEDFKKALITGNRNFKTHETNTPV